MSLLSLWLNFSYFYKSITCDYNFGYFYKSITCDYITLAYFTRV